MIHKILIIAGILLLVAAALIIHRRQFFCLHAMHHPGFHKKISDRMIKKMAGELDLSDEQKTMLTEIRDEMIEAHEKNCAGSFSSCETVIREIEKEELDKEALSALFEEKVECIRPMHALAVDRLADFHATLSPEQKKKLTVLIEKHHSRMIE